MSTFRTVFEYGGTINWFPGHMAKAAQNIAERLKGVDVVVEVPFSSANPLLEGIVKQKRRVIMFNKADLANSNMSQRVREYYESRDQPIVFGSATKGSNIPKIISFAVEAARSRFSSTIMLVVGYPNVGKSSLINAFAKRGGGKAQVGALPGVTRHIQLLRVGTNPDLFLFDTPGVLVGKFDSVDVGMRLGLVGAIRDQRIGEEILADYLLFTLNRLRAFRYARRYGLQAPTDDITEVLRAIGKKLGNSDTNACARFFLKEYRESELGRLTLDDIPPEH